MNGKQRTSHEDLSSGIVPLKGVSKLFVFSITTLLGLVISATSTICPAYGDMVIPERTTSTSVEHTASNAVPLPVRVFPPFRVLERTILRPAYYLQNNRTQTHRGQSVYPGQTDAHRLSGVRGLNNNRLTPVQQAYYRDLMALRRQMQFVVFGQYINRRGLDEFELPPDTDVRVSTMNQVEEWFQVIAEHLDELRIDRGSGVMDIIIRLTQPALRLDLKPESEAHNGDVYAVHLAQNVRIRIRMQQDRIFLEPISGISASVKIPMFPDTVYFNAVVVDFNQSKLFINASVLGRALSVNLVMNLRSQAVMVGATAQQNPGLVAALSSLVVLSGVGVPLLIL